MHFAEYAQYFLVFLLFEQKLLKIIQKTFKCVHVIFHDWRVFNIQIISTKQLTCAGVGKYIKNCYLKQEYKKCNQRN